MKQHILKTNMLSLWLGLTFLLSINAFAAFEITRPTIEVDNGLIETTETDVEELDLLLEQFAELTEFGDSFEFVADEKPKPYDIEIEVFNINGLESNGGKTRIENLTMLKLLSVSLHKQSINAEKKKIEVDLNSFSNTLLTKEDYTGELTVKKAIGTGWHAMSVDDRAKETTLNRTLLTTNRGGISPESTRTATTKFLSGAVNLGATGKLPILRAQLKSSDLWPEIYYDDAFLKEKYGAVPKDPMRGSLRPFEVLSVSGTDQSTAVLGTFVTRSRVVWKKDDKTYTPIKIQILFGTPEDFKNIPVLSDEILFSKPVQ